MGFSETLKEKVRTAILFSKAKSVLQIRKETPGKGTRHGLAEEKFQEKALRQGDVAFRIRWPDFLVFKADGTVVLTEVKSIRGNHGKEEVSEDQLYSFELIKKLLKTDVTIEYVNIGDKYERT